MYLASNFCCHDNLILFFFTPGGKNIPTRPEQILPYSSLAAAAAAAAAREGLGPDLIHAAGSTLVGLQLEEPHWLTVCSAAPPSPLLLSTAPWAPVRGISSVPFPRDDTPAYPEQTHSQPAPP